MSDGNRSTYAYVGADLLPLGEQLVNYNNAIADLVYQHGQNASRSMDFGAGIGTLSKRVRARGLDPLCLEPDPVQRAILSQDDFNTVGSLEDVPYDSLDFIYSSNVLEHIEDDLLTLRELRARMCPGGILLLYLPAFQMLYSSVDQAIGHYRRYDRDGLAMKLRASGFKTEHLYYADFTGFMAALAYKYLGNNLASVNQRSLSIYDRYIFPLTMMLEKVAHPPVGKNVVAVARK